MLYLLLWQLFITKPSPSIGLQKSVVYTSSLISDKVSISGNLTFVCDLDLRLTEHMFQMAHLHVMEKNRVKLL